MHQIAPSAEKSTKRNAATYLLWRHLPLSCASLHVSLLMINMERKLFVVCLFILFAISDGVMISKQIFNEEYAVQFKQLGKLLEYDSDISVSHRIKTDIDFSIKDKLRGVHMFVPCMEDNRNKILQDRLPTIISKGKTANIKYNRFILNIEKEAQLMRHRFASYLI